MHAEVDDASCVHAAGNRNQVEHHCNPARPGYSWPIGYNRKERPEYLRGLCGCSLLEVGLMEVGVMNFVSQILVMCCVAVLMVIAPQGLGADDSEPTQTPTPVPTKVPEKRPKTLSDLAGGIKLQQPEGENVSGVVIDNANLKAMGDGAVFSQGGSLSSSAPGPGTKRSNSGSDTSMRTSGEMERLRGNVQNLEAQRKALDDAANERNKTNMYTGAGPQYRPPGVEDPLDLQREKVDRELDTAKKNLKAAERKARRKGPSSPQEHEPPPTDD